MSIQTIVRRSLSIAFTLTVAGTAFAADGGYRDMLARNPSAHAATTVAAVTGYRGSVARVEAAPFAHVAAPARGYRDVLVRFQAPTNPTGMQMARR